MGWTRVEAELVMYGAVKDLLAKTNLKPRQIDVLGEAPNCFGVTQRAAAAASDVGFATRRGGCSYS